MHDKRIIPGVTSINKPAADQAKSKKSRRILLPAALGLALTALISLPSSASAANWYVSPISSPAAQAAAYQKVAAAAQNQAATDQYFSSLCKQFAADLSAAGDQSLAALLNEYANVYSQDAAQLTALANNDLQQAKQLNSEATGTSWTTAWPDLSSINWTQVQTGDRIELDAGTTPGQTVSYVTPLVVGKSGVAVEVSNQSGHNAGFARLQPLSMGIAIIIPSSVSNVNINGQRWLRTGMTPVTRSPQLVIDGAAGGVFGIIDNSTKAQLSNIEIRNCQEGVHANFGGIACYNLMVHDNTNNVLVSGSGNPYSYIENSWIYNAKPLNVIGAGVSGMYGTGLYTFGATNSGPNIMVENTILGPGLNTAVNNNCDGFVQLQSDLILDPATCSIRTVGPGVQIVGTTSFLTPLNYQGTGSSCLTIQGQMPPELIMGSIFYGGSVNASSNLFGSTRAQWNTQFRTSGSTQLISPTEIDPQFVSDVGMVGNNASFSQLCSLSFRVQPGSPASGGGTSSNPWTSSVSSFLQMMPY